MDDPTEFDKNELIESLLNDKSLFTPFDFSNSDILLKEAIKIVWIHALGSIDLLKRRLKITEIRAEKLLNQMLKLGIVSYIGNRSYDPIFLSDDEIDVFLQTGLLPKQIRLKNYYDNHKVEIDSITAEKCNNQLKNDLKKNPRRQAIPQEVMDSVWNRDGGMCVLCGGQESLEFDHIIPFSKDGANTYRNLQILCRNCNIKKSNRIGN